MINPTGVLELPGPPAATELTTNLVRVASSLASVVIGIGSMVVRWRRAGRQVRRQITWVLSAFGLLLATVVARVVDSVLVGIDLGVERLIDVATALAIAAICVLVVDVGRLVPATRSQGSRWGVTAVVAVVFDPVRRRVQAWVNRLMFGQRGDPYAVLSRLVTRWPRRARRSRHSSRWSPPWPRR